jgi:thiol-disulfide isomerase/thioredoxin
MVTVDKNITNDVVGDVGDDWRFKLFGDSILLNSKVDDSKLVKDVENPEAPIEDFAYTVTKTMPTPAFFEGYDYIALFFGANYCPFCKKFAPSVVASKPYLEAKKCKVIYVSNDRDQENFDQSCAKVRGLDVMQYDTSKTGVMRDMFGLKTIPALMVLANKDFHLEQPHVYSNAREILELDPQCKNFPWGSIESRQAAPVTAWERIWISGRHGSWWQLGHRGVSEVHPADMYMDEHAVRTRAGLLNIVTIVAVMNVFFIEDPSLVNVIFPLVAWEFVSSMIFGLTPFAPLGWIGTIMAVILQPKPLWKPASPKRFAWLIGLFLATTCFILVQYRHDLGAVYKPAVTTVALTCSVATWLEGNAGFCIGCFIYNNVLTKYFHYEECKECKL